jgi:hypothetical protein
MRQVAARRFGGVIVNDLLSYEINVIEQRGYVMKKQHLWTLNNHSSAGGRGCVRVDVRDWCVYRVKNPVPNPAPTLKPSPQR